MSVRSQLGRFEGRRCLPLVLAIALSGCTEAAGGPEYEAAVTVAAVDQQAVELTPEEGFGALIYDVGDRVSALAVVSNGVLVGTEASIDRCVEASECASGGCDASGSCQCDDPTDCLSDVCLDGVCQGHGVQLLSGVHFYSVPVVSAEGEPVTSGAVLDMVPRADSVLVLAANGLFYTSGSELAYSPLNAALAGLDGVSIAVSGEGEAEVVWMVAADGLYRVAESSLAQVTVPDVATPATSVVEAGGVALIAFEGGAIWEVATGSDWAARPLGADLGAVHAMATGGGEMAAATDNGLLWRRGDGAYELLDVGEAVTAVSSDGVGGFVALTAEAVVLFSGGVVTRSVPSGGGAEHRGVTVDVRGHAWHGDGTSLVGLMVGEIIGFDEEACGDASPCKIMSTNCNVCHLEGGDAPKHDFAKYAEALALADDIVHRVSIGNMPLGFSLSPSELDTLLTWYITGQHP